MLDNAAKDKLVALRAEGWSYDRISKELRISSSTAYDWGAKLKNDIDKLRAIRLEAMQERVFGEYEQELTYTARPPRNHCPQARGSANAAGGPSNLRIE